MFLFKTKNLLAACALSLAPQTSHGLLVTSDGKAVEEANKKVAKLGRQKTCALSALVVFALCNHCNLNCQGSVDTAAGFLDQFHNNSAAMSDEACEQARKDITDALVEVRQCEVSYESWPRFFDRTMLGLESVTDKDLKTIYEALTKIERGLGNPRLLTQQGQSVAMVDDQCAAIASEEVLRQLQEAAGRQGAKQAEVTTKGDWFAAAVAVLAGTFFRYQECQVAGAREGTEEPLLPNLEAADGVARDASKDAGVVV